MGYGNENMDGLNELNRDPRAKASKNIRIGKGRHRRTLCDMIWIGRLNSFPSFTWVNSALWKVWAKYFMARSFRSPFSL